MPEPSAREAARSVPSRIASAGRPASGGSGLVAVWQVTLACDQACFPCRSTHEPLRDPGEISLNDGHRLLEQVRSLGSSRVILTGGDPLKRPDLFELARFAREIGLSPELGASATGLLTPDAILRCRDSGITGLALGLDGAVPADHDALRGVPGSFQRTVAAAREAARLGLGVRVVSRISPENLDRMEQMARLAAGVGASTWTAAFGILGWDATPGGEDPAQRVERALHDLYRLSLDAPLRITTIDAPHYGRVVLQEISAWSGAEMDAVVVGSGGSGPGDPLDVVEQKNTLYISHRGEVFPAHNLPVLLGRTWTGELAALCRESQLLTALRDPDRLGGRCGACPFRGFCGGSRARAYAATGDALSEDPLCPYIPPGPEH